MEPNIMRHINLLLILVLLTISCWSSAQMPFESSNIRVSCFDLSGLNKRLQTVVDEQQVFNNDQKTWSSKDNCSIDSPDLLYTADSKVAKEARAFGNRGKGLGFIGWIVTDKWLVPVEKVYFLKARFNGFRPAGIYDRKQYTLPKKCFDHTIERDDVVLVGHQYSVGNVVDEVLGELCSKPKLVNAKSVKP